VATTPFATYNKLSGTQGRDLDAKLWAALAAKHPILDMLSRPKVNAVKYEWEIDVMPTRVYTATTGTNINGSATNQTLVLTNGANIAVKSILRNVSRATPVGTVKTDELLEVTANNNGTLTVARNVGLPDGSTAGNGSTAHGATDQFEVVYQPKLEGSGMEENKYTDVTLVSNYTTTVDFFLSITGDQKASAPAVAADSLTNQVQKCMLNLANDLERLFFYGVINQTTPAGSSTEVRRSKGLDQFIALSGGNVDYTTGNVTETALNALIYNILTNKTDPSDKFIIAAHPYNTRKISAFGADKVRVGQDVTKWGRTIDTFVSDMGVELPIIWTLNIPKSDLYIIDMDKVSMPVFRPFEVAEVTYADDGTDAWRQRYLTSVGVKVIDPLYSFGKLAGLTWTA